MQISHEVADWEVFYTERENSPVDLSMILRSLESCINSGTQRERFKHCSCSTSTESYGSYHILVRSQLYDEQSKRWLVAEVKVSKQLLEMASRQEISRRIATDIYNLFLNGNLVYPLGSWSWTESLAD